MKILIVNGETRRRPRRSASLAPGRKNLEFHYTGLSFLAPTRITFRYMLDGYDKNWIDAGTRREAFYTNLPPGNFRFRVTACNVDGVCATKRAAAIAFTLAPALLSAGLVPARCWRCWRRWPDGWPISSASGGCASVTI